MTNEKIAGFRPNIKNSKIRRLNPKYENFPKFNLNMRNSEIQGIRQLICQTKKITECSLNISLESNRDSVIIKIHEGPNLN